MSGGGGLSAGAGCAAGHGGEEKSPSILLVSFAHTNGVPTTPLCDLYADLRGLPNPAWVLESYEERTGVEEEVQQLVFEGLGGRKRFSALLDKVRGVLRKEGAINKEEATTSIAIGCKSGKHRSVAFVERLARALRKGGQEEGGEAAAAGADVVVEHLDAGHARKNEKDTRRRQRRWLWQDSESRTPGYACAVCGVTADGAPQFNEHIRGKRHLKRIAKAAKKRKRARKAEASTAAGEGEAASKRAAHTVKKRKTGS